MKLGVVISATVIAVFVAVLCTAVFSSPASADVTPGCTATLNGQSANVIDTPGTALDVDIDSDVAVVGTGPKPIVYHSAGLEFAAIKWTVTEGDDDGTDNSFSDTVAVSDYAAFSAGLYKVNAEIEMFDGTTCQAYAFVNVTGSGLFTAVGLTGIALAAAGAAALAYSAWQSQQQYQQYLANQAAQNNTCSCPVLAVQAVLLTFAAMGTGAGAKPVVPSTPPSSAPSAPGGKKLRWRFSVLAMGAGVVGALGGLVVMQQAGMVYPTLNVTIISLVIGLLVGIGLPTLTRSLWGGRVKKEKSAK